MSAADIARTAYQLALDAAESARREEDARQLELARQRAQRASATFEAGSVVLDEWFPGVEWDVWDDRSDIGCASGYGHGNTVILYEKGSDLRLAVERRLLDRNKPESGYRVVVYYVTGPHTDSGTGYVYYSGQEVKSAADVGRLLAGKQLT